ncbi:hypothetical protein [Atopomonas sediminilitoris]|uniref:hypothetical protein n=1 Tax=Atopomonas sediminilitoris TaxID=2919919 RepID=UPI001F4EF9A3|nr:hypothetical protein [Atopomonas sediminilitoris]MCJ8169258.1 hypothetical protein [Atopomonas sediminilitoris]
MNQSAQPKPLPELIQAQAEALLQAKQHMTSQQWLAHVAHAQYQCPTPQHARALRKALSALLNPPA